MILNIKGKKYTLENTNLNINKFVELTIWGIKPKYLNWYREFQKTEYGNEIFRKLNGLY